MVAALEPLGHHTIVYMILGTAAISIPLHVFAVARSIRSSNRKRDEGRRRRAGSGETPTE